MFSLLSSCRVMHLRNRACAQVAAAWIMAVATSLLITCGGCRSQSAVITGLDQFASQGAGTSSVDDLIAQVTSAVKAKNMPQLQELTCGHELTPALQKEINTQYLAVISKPLNRIEFIDDTSVLKSPLLTDWAWYVYQPEKHDPLIAASAAAFEEQATAEKSDKPPVELIPQPGEPDNAGHSNVRPLGILRIESQGLGETAGNNSLFFIVGKHPQSQAIYLGAIIPAPRPDPATTSAEPQTTNP